MDRLMLLDGNGLIYRGYFALPPLTTSRGELVNAVFGFCSIVLRGFQDIGPDFVAVAFDLPGPTFRHERFAEYKATRQRMPDDLRDQFPKVREVVKALRIPVYEFAGYEADDVIGTLTVEAERRGLDTTIVTGDLDMLQLVTDHTRLMTTRSGVQNTILYDPERIRERYDLRPDQIVDFKALKGDSTDNVPGVPGVGEKTAAKLINRWETLDGVYEHIDEVEPVKLREPLLAAKERVLESRELMRIVRDLPVELDLETARLGDYDRETVVRLFREYEFRTLIERLPPLSGERADETVFALRAETADGSFPAAQVPGRAPDAGSAGGNGRGPGAPPAHPRCSAKRPASSCPWISMRSAGPMPAAPVPRLGSRPATRIVDAASLEALPAEDPRDALAALIAEPARVAVVDEAAVPDLRSWLEAQPAVGVALLQDDPRPRRGTALALGVAGTDGRTIAAEGPAASEALRRLLVDVRVPLVGHEVKRLLVASAGAGEELPEVAFDTQVAAYLINASLRSQTIADIVAEQLDLILPDPAGLDATARAGLDALSVIAARPPLERGLAAEKLDRLFAEIELPLIPVLARMESAGVAIDRDRLSALATRVRGRDLPARGRDLRRRRPRVQPGQPQAARAGALLGAQPAEGQEDEDRLLDRCIGARGAPPRAPDDRQAPRVADIHEAALDLRRRPADADRRRRAAAHDVPPGRGRHRAPLVVRPEPAEHPDPVRAGPADPARRSWPAARTSCSSRPTTRRSSCASSPTSPATSTSRRRSRATPTSTATRPRACSTRSRPTSRPTSARWPRWSTSGSPTG